MSTENKHILCILALFCLALFLIFRFGCHSEPVKISGNPDRSWQMHFANERLVHELPGMLVITEPSNCMVTDVVSLGDGYVEIGYHSECETPQCMVEIVYQTLAEGSIIQTGKQFAHIDVFSRQKGIMRVWLTAERRPKSMWVRITSSDLCGRKEEK